MRLHRVLDLLFTRRWLRKPFPQEIKHAPQGQRLTRKQYSTSSKSIIVKRFPDMRLCTRHVTTLMKRMGIEALYRRPRTTKPEPGHKVYPYLLRGAAITRPNQVWAMDITYIPMARGFVYLAVALDWFSRRVLSWRVSITMEAAFCVETLQEALAKHGKPESFNTDQGSQFTGAAFTGLLIKNSIAISMDGKGAWRDNVFVERLWRSVKYEEVYLRAYGRSSFIAGQRAFRKNSIRRMYSKNCSKATGRTIDLVARASVQLEDRHL